MGWLNRLFSGGAPWQTPPFVPPEQASPAPAAQAPPRFVAQPAVPPQQPQQQPQQSPLAGLAPTPPTIRSNPLSFLLGGQSALTGMYNMQLAQHQQQLAQQAEQRNQAMFGMQQTQFERQRQDWTRQDQQREAVRAWIQTRPESEREMLMANPEMAYEAYLQAHMAANQPITPFQQQQLELQRRGLGIDYMNAQANIARANVDRPLRGPDATLLSSVREAAARSQGLSSLGDRFLAGNARNATGELSQFNPLNLVSPERADMRAASAQMRGFMRPPNSGATSDFEQRLYGLGAMQTTNTGPQNQAIGAAYRTQAALDQARMNFYEAWAYDNGNLYGAEQAFQQSSDFQRIRSEFVNRYGDPTARADTQPNGGEVREQQSSAQQSFDTLPSPRGFREGQTITDTQTGRRFVIRDGQWQPVRQPAENLRGRDQPRRG